MNSVHSSTQSNTAGSKDVEQRDDDDDEEKRNVEESRSVQRVNREPYSYRLFRLLIDSSVFYRVLEEKIPNLFHFIIVE